MRGVTSARWNRAILARVTRWVALAVVLVGCTSEEEPFASHADRSSYPEGPYGLDVGDTIEEYRFDTTGGPLPLQELRGDRNDRLLVLFGVQTWPNACAAEADYLARAYDDYQRRGVDVPGVLVEDFETPATAEGAREYFEILHDAPYRYAASPEQAEPSFRDALGLHGLVASPVNLVVDLDTMAITAVISGWSRAELESHLYYDL